ncbi:MAG: TetR/AcrR family transcriptional regulator [Propionibacteriales bacterium]|nr:TetR/AcrR family transcriptional regulator [Propionibacteriales bacterium]
MSTRSPAEKIRSTIPKVAGVSRRQQYSASTKRALVDVALRLFTEQGYAATSLDQVVAGARVTKGALYHHFSGKQAVFEAAFEKIETDASARIRKALKGSKDPWEKALIGLRAFLEIVQDPAYQRVVIQEGPAILGYERFREQEERSSYGLVQDMVRDVLADSTYDLSDEMLETFSRIFFGAMSAAGESVSSSANPKAAVAQVETAIAFILTGLRTLADNGVELPDPEDLLTERIRDNAEAD